MSTKSKLSPGFAASEEAGAPDIGITPAMSEAGAQAIFEFREDYSAWPLAEAIYRAMEQARKYPRR
jgi:hypothetical protein